ncbi:hypothetical protein VKT23_015306 [Stygiomarasmius scandens]|uniref:Uncharacterized protein n=1 Tax=Marasmiellus scandens TaxID=2682957 RepID=A0ABR1J0S4_9AGAR
MYRSLPERNKRDDSLRKSISEGPASKTGPNTQNFFVPFTTLARPPSLSEKTQPKYESEPKREENTATQEFLSFTELRKPTSLSFSHSPIMPSPPCTSPSPLPSITSISPSISSCSSISLKSESCNELSFSDHRAQPPEHAMTTHRPPPKNRCEDSTYRPKVMAEQRLYWWKSLAAVEWQKTCQEEYLLEILALAEKAVEGAIVGPTKSTYAAGLLHWVQFCD